MTRSTSTMTFLFTDIEGSTRRWEESPTMFEQVEHHFAVLRSAVDAAGGEVFATLGDGVAAAFASADAAVQAAVSAQHQMRAVGLGVRMGIHTGEVERSGSDYRGRPVNRAARIMAVGHAGQVLLSDVTASLLRSASAPGPLGLADVGTHRLRDLAEPERLWQVVHPDLDNGFPPLRGIDAYATNLPTQRSSLVGRQLDAQRVISMLQRHRIVTLTGVGGVGKTRLAVHAAADLVLDFADVWFVPLACVTDPDDVLDAIAVAVGVTAAPETMAATVGALAGNRTLLVVDNCEHVIDGAAAVIDVLIARCPDLSVIATSREALGIDGEQVMGVRPLEPSTTAVELFRQRAKAAGADLGAVGRSSIEELCARLDGLPLAIELAAAQTATLGVAAVTGALDDRRALLHRGRRGGDDRHCTMRATIEWSYRLLDADEQRMFRWLAVFANGFELDAACHIAGAMGISELAAIQHVESLVRKSMVSADAVGQGVRYRMLETMRAFAMEQLDDRDERDAALTAMARWLTTIAGLAAEDPCNAAVERCSIRLEREADNWREAVLLAARLRSGELAAGLCGPPADFFLLGRHDLADVVRPLLDVCDDPRQRRAVLCALIVSASGGTDPAQLERWAAEVQEVDDQHPTGLGGLMRWLALAWRGDFEASIEVCVEASLDPELRQATRDMFVGIAVLDHFSLTDVRDDVYGLVPRALEIADRSEVALSRVSCLLGVAWALADTDPGRSVALVRRALDDITDVPALTRLTLPGSASRLLSRLDPQIAAQALLEQLDATPSLRSFVDLIPLFYGAALLDRLGRVETTPVLAALTSRQLAPSLSMMDFVDHARRASSHRNTVWARALETAVRDGLADLAGNELLPAACS